MSEAENFKRQWLALGPAHKFDVHDYEIMLDPSQEAMTFDFWNGEKLEFQIHAIGSRNYNSLEAEEAQRALECADDRIRSAKLHREHLIEQIRLMENQ